MQVFHVVGLDTGWSEEGLNPASSWSIPVEKPKVALLVDPPFNSYTAGQLWFLFEEWTEFSNQSNPHHGSSRN